MIEIFLKNNWRSVILLAAVLFVWLVWPSPYSYYKGKDSSQFRRNRLTEKVESYWGGLGEWRYNDWDSYNKAKQDDDNLKMKSMVEGDSKK